MTYRFATVLAAFLVLGVNACASNAPLPPPSGPEADERAARMADRLFDRLDTDANGIIEFAEIETDRIATFNRMDLDGSGAISASEMTTLRDEVDQSPRQGGRRNVDPIRRMDRNRDGRITLNEFDGLQGSLLDRADFNGDGNIERVELEDMIARMPSRRPR